MDCTNVQFATWYSPHHTSMLVLWRQQVSNLQRWIIFSFVLVVNSLQMISILCDVVSTMLQIGHVYGSCS
jgi:hypothetical protein